MPVPRNVDSLAESSWLLALLSALALVLVQVPALELALALLRQAAASGAESKKAVLESPLGQQRLRATRPPRRPCTNLAAVAGLLAILLPLQSLVLVMLSLLALLLALKSLLMLLLVIAQATLAQAFAVALLRALHQMRKRCALGAAEAQLLIL
jgi:hypothetical protein